MNNEIGRKITSLTLMTIMFAGGMTFAVPGVMPLQQAHAANANLFVSAENSQFDNYMSGPQVIEVVIIDPDIQDTDEGKGEPDVTVNGKKLRMAQASDGNWYGYFADRKQALIADSTVNDASNSNPLRGGAGLDFGLFCSASSGTTILGFTTTETVGFAIPTINNTGATGTGTNGTSSPSGSTVTATCDATLFSNPNSDPNIERNGTANVAMNVVREAKQLNLNSNVDVGQIGFGVRKTVNATGGVWPFIQLYNLNPTGNVVVQYNKGGGVQSTTLTFDTADQFAGLDLDRAKYPRKAEVHYTITDLWLNIDPTDEDSWTFGTNSTSNSTQGAATYYQVFDENGAAAGASKASDRGIIPIEGNTFGDLMCEDNCILLLNTDKQSSGTPVVAIEDNDDTVVNFGGDGSETARNAFVGTGAVLGKTQQPLTITEQGPNSGIFGSYDEGDDSNLRITSSALRGTSATIDYNDTPQNIVVGFDFATVDIQPIDDEWSSGESIPVTIVDNDANKNSRVDEDLDLNNPQVDLIPALAIGDPFTFGENAFDDSDGDATKGVNVNATFVPRVSLGDNNVFKAGSGLYQTKHLLSASDSTAEVQRFSHRMLITPDSSTGTRGVTTVGGLFVDLETDATSLRDSIFDTRDSLRGFNLLNFDLRSINSTITEVEIFLAYNSSSTGDVIDNSDSFIPSQVELISLANVTSLQGLENLNGTDADNLAILTQIFDNATFADTSRVGFFFNFTSGTVELDGSATATDNGPIRPIVADLFSFGFTNSGVSAGDRVSNQIVRIEAEETGDNTSTFEGELEYVALNQLNILDAETYTGLSTIADDPSFIVMEDLTDEDSPRVNYMDLGADGVSTQVADQEEAPTHSGVVSFDANNYKIADTVTVTLEDADLNTDSDLIDIFTVVSTANDTAIDAVGEAALPTKSKGGEDFSFGALGRVLDITFDDERWQESNQADGDGVTCNTARGTGAFTGIDDGLGATGFTLQETGPATGVFTGDFQIPSKYCQRSGNSGAGGDATSTTGTDIEVNYVDFRDASGEIIEVGDSAGVRANTGSISLDRTVYPVPWGVIANFATESSENTPNGRSVFPIHATGIDGALDAASETLGSGDLVVHIRVNDPDFDVSASGEDTIEEDVANDVVGPVKITVSRGAEKVLLAYAGGSTSNSTGLIDVGADGVSDCSKADPDGDGSATNTKSCVRQLGEITEIAPDAGIFELDFTIRYTDGPDSSLCPTTSSTGFTNLDGAGTSETDRFDTASATGENYCILQGDILTVEYTDPTDASGDPNTVTDSATFDLRNGVLQSDKSVYIIGSDAILTVIEPDWDLDNDAAETYDLDVLEWDSDAATVTMGDKGGSSAAFDPEPTDFRETGDSTGIFQIVVEIPSELAGDKLERGEAIVLEYTDWGPSGSDFVGDEEEDINLDIFTSNFGATIELDQKVYSWTDKVFITIVAPDHNFDSDLIDEIGESSEDPIKVATRGSTLSQYKLVETGTDTGIFTGEVILTGFTSQDADGDGTTGDASGTTGNADGSTKTGLGPTDGFLAADDDDGITVSFEFSEDETVVGSALIRWNIGEVQWLEASYPATGTGVVRVVDPDMNLDPEAVDNFDVDVWSDSDSGGIDLTVTETNEATGIFEGTVFFTTTDESSGHRLRVSEGDTITAEYEDNTLPDPYTKADELDVTATAIIGTIVPPLERAPAANARVVDAFGNTLDTVSVDQQVQITADLANGQDREQAFAYLVQVQDSNGVTVSLAWITGSLSPGQSFSPALSWIPTQPGTYTATVFVWESVDNPTALSPPVETTINVQ